MYQGELLFALRTELVNSCRQDVATRSAFYSVDVAIIFRGEQLTFVLKILIWIISREVQNFEEIRGKILA